MSGNQTYDSSLEQFAKYDMEGEHIMDELRDQAPEEWPPEESERTRDDRQLWEREGDEEHVRPQYATAPDTEGGIKIGLWGTVSSGKTTYLATLYHELPKHTRWRVQADPPAMRFVTQTYRRMRTKRGFPVPTTADPTEIKAYSYRLFQPGTASGRLSQLLQRSGQAPEPWCTLRFVDASGEWFSDPEGMKGQFGYASPNPFDYLQECEGIVCLFDPTKVMPPSDGGSAERTSEELEEEAFEYFSHVLELLASLQHASHDTKPRFIRQKIAFCLSKIDVTGLWEHRKDPRDLARRVLGEDVMIQIEQYCEPGQYDFFTISSIGVLVDADGRAVPNKTDDNKIRKPSDLKPFNLHAPIDWLVRKLLQRST